MELAECNPSSVSHAACPDAPVNGDEVPNRAQDVDCNSNPVVDRAEGEISDVDTRSGAEPPVPRVSIHSLTDEVMLRILSTLSLSELTETIPEVCTRWEQLSRDRELWRDKVYYINGSDSEGQVRKFLQRWNQVHSVIITREVEPSVIRALCNCKHLTNLEFSYTQGISSQLLTELVENCQNIHSLTIPHTLLQDEYRAHTLAQLHQLQTLKIIEGRHQLLCFCHSDAFHVNPFVETKIHLRPFAHGCLKLNTLELSVPFTSLADLEYFFEAKHKTLTSLTIPWATVSDGCVTRLLNVCTSLTHLQLIKYSVIRLQVREDLVALGRLSNLRTLNMHHVKDIPSGALAHVFKHGGLSQLQELDMSDSDTEGSAAVLAICRGCPALKKLILASCWKISDGALKELFRLTQLEVLDLSFCESLMGDALKCVSQIFALRELYLKMTDLSKLKCGLLHILEIESLERLHLGSTYKCSFPFNKIATKLTNLRYLEVSEPVGCTKDLEKLKVQMPNLIVDSVLW